MDDRQKIISKIQKCLRLSKSGNEHEAAAALRQAHALMQKYRIDQGEVLASEIGEARAKAAAKSKPVIWECALAHLVARFFECLLVFAVGAGEWIFIGTAPAPEIARYAYQSLMRQAKSARKTYRDVELKRCKVATQTRRADVFCGAWVVGVRRPIQEFVTGELPVSAAVEAYMATHFPKTNDLTPANRNSNRKQNALSSKDWSKGYQSGREARLNHGVGAESNAAAICGPQGQ